jgi:hypothetical protein
MSAFEMELKESSRYFRNKAQKILSQRLMGFNGEPVIVDASFGKLIGATSLRLPSGSEVGLPEERGSKPRNGALLLTASRRLLHDGLFGFAL